MTEETLTTPIDRRQRLPATPGIVAVFVSGRPATQLLRWGGKPVSVGRSETCTLGLPDKELSRQHLELRYLGGTRWNVKDLASHNGTFVNGERISGERLFEGDPIVVRAGGETVLLLQSDISRFNFGTVDVTDRVTGPSMQDALDRIENAARAGVNVLVQGESGAGKEHAARYYHAKSRNSRGPFKDVNCAAINKSLAESEIFGAKKGAFSGADADRPGYIASADKGVLFLDEIGTLDLEIQAKLLRVLEQRTVQALGSATPRKVDFLLVSATNVDMRDAVARGTFRQDLYARIAQEVVTLPPLRSRPEELSHLVMLALRELSAEAPSLPPIRPTGSFIEECLLRDWPSNVRELMLAVKAAARAVGRAGHTDLLADDLDPVAGLAIGAAVPGSEQEDEQTRVDALVRAYQEGQSVEAAAKTTGFSRSAAYRWLAKRGVLRKK